MAPPVLRPITTATWRFNTPAAEALLMLKAPVEADTQPFRCFVPPDRPPAAAWTRPPASSEAAASETRPVVEGKAGPERPPRPPPPSESDAMTRRCRLPALALAPAF